MGTETLEKQRPRALGTLGPQGQSTFLYSRPDYTATVESCNKWLTMWRHNHGYLSREGCEAAFSAHPEWSAA